MRTMTRRQMFQSASAGAAALALAPWASLRAADEEGFTLPKLPYAYDALDVAIDKQTMEIHHDKHHKAYVDNLNKALAKHPELLKKPVEELLRDISKLPDDKALRTAVINNGGGHANHTLFWEIMGPPKKDTEKPTGDLAKAIDETFGSLAKLQEDMKAKALGQFGSGWSWLVVEKGKLKTTNLPNQISPLMEGQTPILGVDVWEHAYYLRYQNKRADYVDAWWKVVNWPAVGEKFTKAVKS